MLPSNLSESEISGGQSRITEIRNVLCCCEVTAENLGRILQCYPKLPKRSSAWEFMIDIIRALNTAPWAFILELHKQNKLTLPRGIYRLIDRVVFGALSKLVSKKNILRFLQKHISQLVIAELLGEFLGEKGERIALYSDEYGEADSLRKAEIRDVIEKEFLKLRQRMRRLWIQFESVEVVPTGFLIGYQVVDFRTHSIYLNQHILLDSERLTEITQQSSLTLQRMNSLLSDFFGDLYDLKNHNLALGHANSLVP